VADQGKSVADYRVDAQAQTLKRNGAASGEPDLIDKAFSDRRKITAANLAKETEASTAAGALRAQNELLELEKANRDLRAEIVDNATQANPRPPDVWQEFLLAELAQARERAELAQRDAQAANRELFNDRVKILEDELARRSTASEPPRADEMESALSTIEKASALMERIRPPAPTPVPDLGYDISLEKWKLTLQNEREQRMAEREDRRWERELEDRKERERLAREEAVVAKESESRSRFVDATLPRVMDMLEPVVKVFVQKMQVTVAGTPAPQPAVATPSAVSPQVQGPPPGFDTLTCQSCGAAVSYRPDWDGAGCLNCGAWYANDHQPPNGRPVQVNGTGDHFEEGIG
jgi:hypothetical protein